MPYKPFITITTNEMLSGLSSQHCTLNDFLKVRLLKTNSSAYRITASVCSILLLVQQCLLCVQREVQTPLCLQIFTPVTIIILAKRFNRCETNRCISWKSTYISENLLLIEMSFLEPNIIYAGCILSKMGPYVRTVNYLPFSVLKLLS
jgi:hypothetical protein